MCRCVELVAEIECLKTRIDKLESKGGRFRPPEFEDVAAYMTERIGNRDIARQEAEIFMDHFIAVGWKVGKKLAPMKDWKAAVRQWLRGKNTNQAGLMPTSRALRSR